MLQGFMRKLCTSLRKKRTHCKLHRESISIPWWVTTGKLYVHFNRWKSTYVAGQNSSKLVIIWLSSLPRQMGPFLKHWDT